MHEYTGLVDTCQESLWDLCKISCDSGQTRIEEVLTWNYQWLPWDQT